ncbi:hypothetical protein [Streptomyces sp. TLI_053]|uniref:hypothetical protein n=1 Tax=Streptomyces sp. TLI_053 TaxID=1855352 RepID=UPI0013520D25|nr:hypothetical protein [Streptomyces sp. TLI_053]
MAALFLRQGRVSGQGHAVSLREIAARPHVVPPDADQCPGCAFFDRAQAQYPKAVNPTIGRMLARNRARHLEDGECVASEVAGE